MRTTALLLLLHLLVTGTNAQSFRAIRRADSLRAAGQIKSAITAYAGMLQKQSNNEIARYNLACAYAVNQQPDSAFAQLDIMQRAGHDLSDALTDADFIVLHKDRRWPQVESGISKQMESREQFRMQDLEYARALWRMKALDQYLYAEIAEAGRREGKQGPASKRLWARKDSLNRRNQKELDALIRVKGFPKKSQVGSSAASAAFLVIQHADSNMQSRYLPELLALCKAGEGQWEAYALMYDRLQMARNLPQRYGSQIRNDPQTSEQSIWKLEDPGKVEAWRREIGMEPLSQYAQRFGLTFP